MTSTNQTDQILKVDVLGRVHTPRERRERLLDEFEHSALSGVEFARLSGIKYQTLASWLQARRRRRGSYPAANPKVPSTRWIEAVVEPHRNRDDAGVSLVVDLPGGARTQVSNAVQAGLLVAVLAGLARDGKGRAVC